MVSNCADDARRGLESVGRRRGAGRHVGAEQLATERAIARTEGPRSLARAATASSRGSFSSLLKKVQLFVFVDGEPVSCAANLVSQSKLAVRVGLGFFLNSCSFASTQSSG